MACYIVNLCCYLRDTSLPDLRCSVRFSSHTVRMCITVWGRELSGLTVEFSMICENINYFLCKKMDLNILDVK